MWAVGMTLALSTIALLVVKFYPGIWEDLSKERLEQVATLIGILLALVVVIVLVAIGGASLGWTGLANTTIWDWLQLLIVPAILSLGALLLTYFFDNQRAKSERRQAALEEHIQDQRAQDKAYQTYLNQMGDLMLEKDLRGSKRDAEVRTLARARTITVLRGFDTNHKARVLQFLSEAKLIQGPGEWDKGQGGNEDTPIIDLSGADLQDVDFSSGSLTGATLAEANLSHTTLMHTLLDRAMLNGASLLRANLSHALLPDADLTCIVDQIEGADKEKCANLHRVNLTDAFLPGAHLSGADMRRANLTNAHLAGADLSGADLRRAQMKGAFLSGADLSYANLEDAMSTPDAWTLQNQVKDVDGATMPNGQKYEEWIKKSTGAALLPAGSGSSLKAGKYATDEFEPAFSFTVGDGWRTADYETTDSLSIGGPEKGDLTFATPSYVFEQTPSGDLKQVPAPESDDGWVSWLQSQSNLETSKPVSARVKSASGMRLDVTLASPEANQPPQRCWPLCVTTLVPYSIQLDSDTTARLLIVDVEGRVVVISAATTGKKYDAFVPKAQNVLDTVRWGSLAPRASSSNSHSSSSASP